MTFTSVILGAALIIGQPTKERPSDAVALTAMFLQQNQLFESVLLDSLVEGNFLQFVYQSQYSNLEI